MTTKEISTFEALAAVETAQWRSWDGMPVSWAHVKELAASAVQHALKGDTIAYSITGDAIVVACPVKTGKRGSVRLTWALIRRTTTIPVPGDDVGDEGDGTP